MIKILSVSIVFFIVLLVSLVIIYNKIVRLRNMVEEGWSGIDVQLKRRYDLVPNLINTVKGYLKHERELFTDIVELRSKAMQASSPEGKNIAESGFLKGLGKLMVTLENYPEIKSDEHFLELMQQISEVEQQIQYARRYYNGAVRNYNIGIETFPANIVAFLLKYKSKAFFELESLRERENVSFTFDEIEE